MNDSDPLAQFGLDAIDLRWTLKDIAGKRYLIINKDHVGQLIELGMVTSSPWPPAQVGPPWGVCDFPEIPDQLGCPILPASRHEEAFQAIGRLRKEARDEIDRLIRFLDTTDDYVSRELEDAVDDGPCDDNEMEPSLGSLDLVQDQDRAWRGATDNWLLDCEVDDCDDEPSLGSVGNNLSQEQWAAGTTKDLEDEHDGAEPPEDDEPSLGSFDRMTDQKTAQKPVWWFTNSDAEQDDAERGR
jgi:hypothetical protein